MLQTRKSVLEYLNSLIQVCSGIIFIIFKISQINIFQTNVAFVKSIDNLKCIVYYMCRKLMNHFSILSIFAQGHKSRIIKMEAIMHIYAGDFAYVATDETAEISISLNQMLTFFMVKGFERNILCVMLNIFEHALYCINMLNYQCNIFFRKTYPLLY